MFIPYYQVCNGLADCPDSSRTAFGSSADEQGCRMWSSWGPWSSCSTSCGTGSMSRYRTCPPGDSLHRCWGQDIQRQQCFNTTCPGKQITFRFTNFFLYNIIFLNILIKNMFTVLYSGWSVAAMGKMVKLFQQLQWSAGETERM